MGAEVTIVPSCAFISPCRPRCGESSPCARITRNTRVRETRMSSRIRSRAWTLRWPSPWNGEHQVAANGANSCASDSAGVGPRRPGPAPRSGRRTRARRASARPLPRSTHPLETVAPPRRRGGRRAHRTSASLKGGDAPMRGHAPALNRQLANDPARRPAAHRPAPSDPARDRPAHGSSTPPGDRPPNRLLARPHQATRRAAAAHHVPFPACAPTLAGRQAPDPTAAPWRVVPSVPSPTQLGPNHAPPDIVVSRRGLGADASPRPGARCKPEMQIEEMCHGLPSSRVRGHPDDRERWERSEAEQATEAAPKRASGDGSLFLLALTVWLGLIWLWALFG